MSMLTSDVAIIGAGISGLATAHALQKQNISYLLFEKRQHFGGFIQTHRQDGYLAEAAANSVIADNAFMELVKELSIDDEIVEANVAAKRRYIVRNNQLHAVPMSPLSILKTSLLSTSAKLRLLKEPFAPNYQHASADFDESVSQFVTRRLGRECVDYLFDPLITGIYAGDPDKLSLAEIFPQLAKLEEQGSLLKALIKRKVTTERYKIVSFKKGMQTLIDGLVKVIDRKSVHLETKVIGLYFEGGYFHGQVEHAGKQTSFKTKQLVVATGSAAALKIESLLSSSHAKLTPTKPFHCTSVTALTLGFANSDLARPLDGFGFLIPSVEKKQLLGVIWNSILFPYRAPEGYTCMTCMFGGVRQPQLANSSVDELIDIATNVMSDLGVLRSSGKIEPTFAKAFAWPEAIPQYELDHRMRRQNLDRSSAALPGLHFTGNYINGIKISHCTQRARELAIDIESRRKGN